MTGVHQEVANLLPGKHSHRPGSSMACCPAHPDKTPSLELWTDTNGKLATKCYAGCDHHQVLEAMPDEARRIAEATWTAKVPELIRPRHQPRKPTRPKKGDDAEAVYVYTDEQGTVLFVKKRYPGKRFVQYAPDGTPKRPEGADTLYRLPDVKAAIANGDPVFIVEGEKDADRLAEHGLTATTNPDGAGKWREHHTALLQDADVIVLPDNDEPGWNHADNLEKALQEVAKRVRTVILPVDEKGDVSDWLDQGNDTRDLEALVADTEPVHQRAPEHGIDFLDLTHVLEGEFGEQWLVEPLIPSGRLTAIYAEGKTGKSLLLLEVAIKAAAGEAILRRPAGPPLSVLYVDFEMTLDDLQERILEMGYTPEHERWSTIQRNLHYAQLQPWAAFDTQEGGDMLCDYADYFNADLVIIDTFIRSVEGEENSSDTVKLFHRHTGQRLKAAGRAVVRVDHSGKDSTKGARGTSAKRDDVDLIWRFTAGSDQADVQTVDIQKDASRVSWVPEKFQVFRHHDPVLHHSMPTLVVTPEQTEAMRRIAEHYGTHNDLPSGNQVHKELGGRRQDLLSAVKWIKANGWPASITDPGAANEYF